MEFIAARCPSCGGELRLPDNLKSAKCLHCGADVIVREAIAAAGVNLDNWQNLADKALENGNYQEAYDYFTKLLEYDRDNYSAIFGKAVAAGNLSTPTEVRLTEMMSGIKVAIENAPPSQKDEIARDSAVKLDIVCVRLAGEIGQFLHTTEPRGYDFRTHTMDSRPLVPGHLRSKAEKNKLLILEGFVTAHDYAPKSVEILEHLLKLLASLDRRAERDLYLDRLRELDPLKANTLWQGLESLQIAKDRYKLALENAVKGLDPLSQNGVQTKVEAPTGTGCSTLIVIVLILLSLFIVEASSFYRSMHQSQDVASFVN